MKVQVVKQVHITYIYIYLYIWKIQCYFLMVLFNKIQFSDGIILIIESQVR